MSILTLLRASPFLAILLLLGVVSYQGGQIHKWHVQSDGNAAKADALQTTLDAISTRKNEQQIVTRDHIVTVTRTLKAADDKAKAIEAAPLPGNCHTPKAILDADF